MRIQSFIFCHDQNLILEFLSNGKFNHLPNLKFVFLGTELPVDQIENTNQLESGFICIEFRTDCKGNQSRVVTGKIIFTSLC